MEQEIKELLLKMHQYMLMMQANEAPMEAEEGLNKTMKALNKQEPLPEQKPLQGCYFPSLDSCCKDVTLVVSRPSVAPFNTIEVRLKVPKALAIMGERVHFFLDFPNEAIYIRGHNPDVDTQAPLWEVKYLEDCVSYAYDGCLGAESTEYLESFFSFIEEYYKPAKRTDTFEIKGRYSFEDKALIFRLYETEYERA